MIRYGRRDVSAPAPAEVGCCLLGLGWWSLRVDSGWGLVVACACVEK